MWRKTPSQVDEPKETPYVPLLKCQECGQAMRSDSPSLRIEQSSHDDWIVYCQECWEREYGDS
jgi:hypothetical protein